MTLAIAVGMSSCGDNFLSVETAGTVDETSLMNDKGIDLLLTGAYATLYGNLYGTQAHEDAMPCRTLANPIFGDMLGGDTNEGSQAGDQPDWALLETYAITAANPYIYFKWNYIYEAVKRCNNILSIINRTDGSITNADQVAGQALFLKALWTFEGIRMFGAAIPYVSVADYEANVDPQVSNIDDNGNYVYIWDRVEADLKDAISKLPATWSEGNYGRATSWMAKALLGKVYLYWASPYTGKNGSDPTKLQQAKALLTDVLTNGMDARGNRYRLVDNYETLFAAGHDWDGESIIDIQFTLDGASVWTCSVYGAFYSGFTNTANTGIPTGWGFIQPSNNYANSMMVDSDGLPLPNFEDVGRTTNFTEVYEEQSDGKMVLTERSISTDLSVFVDPRLDITIGRAGVPYLDWGTAPVAEWIRQFTNGGVYVTKKHQTRVSEIGSSSLGNYATSNVKNHHVMRLADVKLMLAEIAIREGDLETARAHINDIRARAANTYVKAEAGITNDAWCYEDKVNGRTMTDAAGNYRIGLYHSFASETEAWTALKRERRAELAGEGHRFFDLARWGDVGETLASYVIFERQYLTKYANTPGNFCTLPIPLSEIQASKGRFVQNADWISK